MNLSDHVSLAEFTATQHTSIDNTLPTGLMANAVATAAMLERIRAFLSAVAGRDVPILITSGYRCPALNAAVGSAPTSDHLKGMAADWTAPAFGSPLLVAQAMAPHVDDLQIGQLIYEHPGSAIWVHTSTRVPDKILNRIITISASGTVCGVQP